MRHIGNCSWGGKTGGPKIDHSGLQPDSFLISSTACFSGIKYEAEFLLVAPINVAQDKHRMYLNTVIILV